MLIRNKKFTFNKLATIVMIVAISFAGIHAAISEEELKEYLEKQYEKDASAISNKAKVASWNFATDVANETKKELQLNTTVEQADFDLKQWNTYFHDLNENNFKDELVKRQVASLKILGGAALGNDKLTELTSEVNTMTNIYSTAKICPYKKQNCNLPQEGLSLDPDMDAILSKSRDYKELEYVWKQWRDASGKKMRKIFKKYVELSNEAATKNGFVDAGEGWRHSFETPDFKNILFKLWNQVKPLYDELHTYVLNKLKKQYGDFINKDEKLIPAHLLGNMWAQSWANIADLVLPFANGSKVDITESLLKQNYTALRMFQVSDEFYQSLGLKSNEMSYGPKAMITKPANKEVVCHASAWDFDNGEDYRIKMCTKINMEDFIVIHHEMGHIQYYIQYKDKPVTLRKGANPGFHEAVGDTIALSVATPQHLMKIKLLEKYDDSYESNINSLMKMALERIAFLPFGFLVDLWRWDVFSGNVTENNWNSHWWKLREQIQKVKTPVQRSENDFDPGAKYHVAGDSQYISYFVAYILEFMFHKSLCTEAGQYDPQNPNLKPLHKCDIYESRKAGAKLSSGLSLGATKHWSEVLKLITGETEMNGQALLDYFNPLMKFLQEQNKAEADHNKAQGESTSQTIPIVVGCVILAVLIVGGIIFVVNRRRRNSRTSRIT